MDPNEIYVKTEKGQAEIKTRLYRLPPDLRSVLIMIDGRYSVAENQVRLKGFGDITTMLKTLSEQGFIEPTLNRASIEIPADELANKKQQISEALYEFLGPVADSWILKIEKTADLNELRQVIETCTDYLEKNTPIKKARRFWQYVEGVLNN